MPRKGKAPTVQKVAEEAAAEAVTKALPAILRAVGREVAEAVEPAVIAAVQASIASAIQKAVAGATGSAAAPVVSFGTPPRAPAAPQGVPTVNSGGGAQAARPEDMDSPEGRAWLADQLARSNAAQPAVQPQERVAVRTGNLMVDRMLSGGIRQAPRESDFA